MSTPQIHSSSAAPLGLPLYGASLGAAVRRVFAKYATFTGRASRSEFWWWYLIVVVVVVALYTLALVTGGAGQVAADGTVEPPRIGFYICFALLWLFLLVSAVPTIALFVRRLHDSNLSGFFAFLVFVPIVNGLIVLILAVRLSVPEGARFDR
ncbi:DUF805 domain-containing protein [Agreia pratensis]|uniref:DUF805 domain-containing protein n=1 Tax=Agreia pratensis TaxID=150121 RepID=UPI00188C7E86|nr:DUF805 domain-containing protein [Agreia pratensis]MBF4634855.1 DUF805 domain-containing protein [Agreia pratensis]